MEQIARADQEIFRELQELCRTGIRRSLDGTRPVEDHMQNVLNGHRIAMLLTPTRAGGGTSSSTGGFIPPPSRPHGEGASARINGLIQKAQQARQKALATVENKMKKRRMTITG